MALTNRVSDQSQETALSVSTSTVEWMPLDGLIQHWADFAHETTNAAGLFAASAAFAALACESAARAAFLDAENHQHSHDVRSWSPRIQENRMEALTQLSTACQHWIDVEPWLSRCTLVHDFTKGQIPDLIEQLGAHADYLFHLFWRVMAVTAMESGEPLRILVGHLLKEDSHVS